MSIALKASLFIHLFFQTPTLKNFIHIFNITTSLVLMIYTAHKIKASRASTLIPKSNLMHLNLNLN